MSNSNFNPLEAIASEQSAINAVKSNLFTAIKVQLHPNIAEFQSPDSYGVYKSTGGSPLGVVGKDFQPFDLNLLWEVLVNSVLECDAPIDLSKAKFTEHYGGKKVTFDLPINNIEIKGSPMVGDVLACKLQFKTGFDGLTKLSLGFYSLRLWCTNGAANWKQDAAISLKNTKNNHIKAMSVCSELMDAVSNVQTYADSIGKLAAKKLTKKQVNAFISKLVGWDIEADLMGKTLHPKRQSILDHINASIATEFDNTGANAFSLLQGITRFSTHVQAEGNESELIYGTAAQYNSKAHGLLMPLVM